MKLKTRDMILVAMFTALTAIGAFIKIPVGPAPITLQFLFTALAGIMLGSRLGALSQLVYVALGLMGIPVFTSGGGISYIFKPTFGYLIGYIVSAYVIGKIAEKVEKPSYVRLFIASLVGIAIVYIIGVPYLYIVLKYVVGAKITVMGALKTGMLLFIPGDIAKCIVTAALSVKVVPIVRKVALN
ncbi:biotin transporter BioY [Clostridium magnum]|uniref:Biotin transporter n=1 Tax=Clostridium magnum DSM 2767 TaxID=1121326 RepID=A0A162R702_9CLOT|nr:biotin transporter BioY [Clostridium magnum]KZL89529.1 biotin transporter BioY [Clostridium magnum DSM 2767]SHH71455.1 biotin transport system substrate-specific component [Clostridium magnum DSM 2767]